jgi:hypothetical protein
MADTPDVTKLCRAQYGYKLKIYVGSSGETLLEGEDIGILKHFIKIDQPNEKMVTFPIFKVGLLCERDQHIVIMQNKKDLVISLSMVCKEIQQAEDSGKNRGVISERVLFDLKFQALIETPEDTHISSKENDIMKESEVGQSGSSDIAQQFKILRFNLSCTKHRNRFKKAVNFVTTADGTSPQAEPFTALCYGIAQSVTEEKAVIIQKPDNTEKELQVIVPPWNLREFISFMQTQYGIYSTGVLVYQDLKYLYVIPKFSEKYAIPDDEFDTVHIYVINPEYASSSNAIGYYSDKDKSEYVITTGGKNAFTPVDTSEALKELQGNKFRVFTADLGEQSTTYDAESWAGTDPMPEIDAGIEGSLKDADDKIRYFHNETENPYLLDEHVLGLQFAQKIISVQLTDVDFSLITFNRKYKLTFLDDVNIDAQYGGIYKLWNVRTMGQADNNEYISSISVLTLMKAPE